MSRFAIIGCLLTAMLAAAAAQDDVKKGDDPDTKEESKKPEPKKVYRNVSAEKLESILADLKIDFKRGKSKEESVVVYTFEKQGRSLRLQNFGGKDLWIDTEYADKISPEMVNDWNVQAKFSRAVRLKGDKGVVSLEAQLDCVGGTSDAIIRQFIGRFEGEVAGFTKFTKKLVDVHFEDNSDDGVHLIVAQDKDEKDGKDAKDVKVFTSLTPEQTEEFLGKQGIEFKKSEPKKGVTLYDFQRKGINARLYNFGGKDLMLDAAFGKIPLGRINEWNRAAKFTRAVMQSSPKGEYTTLESNLDLIGGVTEGGLKQFLFDFEDEARFFAKVVGDGGGDDQVFFPVTGGRLEGVFKSLGIEYDRKELPNGAGAVYEFEAAKYKVRLVNFGGKDLMLDAHFKKLSLDDINQWNLEKKFIRAVAYNVRNTEYSSLECNLDCEAGTTDGILRNYIVGFQEDVKQFAKYVQGK